MNTISFFPPISYDLRRDEIIRMAESEVRRYDLKPGFDIQLFLKMRGFNVKVLGILDFEDINENAMRCWDIGRGEITIPNDIGPTAMRFELARFYGHYRLHLLNRRGAVRRPITVQRYDMSKPTREARLFASALLMPENRFSHDWNRHAGDAAAIAHDYGATIAMIEERAKGLDLPSWH